jgi:gas vesicle protein GvpL/GvpF
VREGDPAFEALREALDTFAADRAPELVAEAQAEAVGRVRSMLADAIAQSLLDHSAAALVPVRSPATPSPPPSAPPGSSRRPKPRPKGRPKRATPRTARSAPAPPGPAVAEPPVESGYYVYGVASARQASLPEALDGVAPGAPVELIEDAGLAAIASRVSMAEFGEAELHENLNDVAWLEATARTHERVLDDALARMTVVPMRLCTVYRDEGQVRKMLAGEREVLVDALERLDGKTEWGVKLFAEEGALERAGAEGGGTLEDGGASAGAAYLERKRRAARARDEADVLAGEWAEEAHARLARVASEALQNPLQRPEVSGHDGEMLLNGVYLVDDEDTEDFRRLVGELDDDFRERGATAELTGPWPPYNFVKGSIEAAR